MLIGFTGCEGDSRDLGCSEIHRESVHQRDFGSRFYLGSDGRNRHHPRRQRDESAEHVGLQVDEFCGFLSVEVKRSPPTVDSKGTKNIV